MYSMPTRFLCKIKKTDSCWIWTSQLNRQGYGQYTVNYKTCAAHRKAWEYAFGEIPEGLFVLHKCNNPSCVNPAHLYLGTHQDNMRDRREAGTVHRAFGERHHNAVLTQAQADQIKILHEEGSYTHQQLATKFGVSRALVGLILAGKRYQ